MKTPVFTGLGTAIITPFTESGVDFAKMAELLDCQIEAGAQAVIVCGTTGENATQPLDEHEKLVDFCVRHSAGRIKIISGVGSNDTMTSVRLATSAKASGVDGILMVTPYYNRTTQAGLVAHFTYVADRIDLPMIVYNVPSRTTMCCSADTLKILSRHPNINGVKESSGDFTLFSMTRYLCGDDLNVWSGNDDQTVPMMALGAKGLVSVASNIIPGQMVKLCDLCLNGDFKAATELHLKYAGLFSDLFIEVNPIPVKAALNLMGRNVGGCRLPLVDISPENLNKLKKTLVEAGIIQ
ncbi:MAG: 4-hydroxy-tetrahydrodipicolinate synthase [Oscillospiraceae bacterium]|nr:4-hydroxy-tetrahydrodipicolinate synthase [Oscillospiraceae bacterium]